jgi:ribonuclease I
MDSPLSKQRENENELAWQKGGTCVYAAPNQIFTKMQCIQNTNTIEDQKKLITS